MKQNTRKTFRYYLHHLGRYKGWATLVWGSIAIALITSMIAPILYKRFFDLLTQGTAAADALIMILIYATIVHSIEWLFWRIGTFSAIHVQSQVMANIISDSFEYLHQHSYNFFNSNFTGGLVKKAARLARAFEGIMDKITYEFIPLIMRGVIILGTLFYLHWILGLTIGIWTMIFIVMNYFLSMYKLKFDLERSKADTRVTATLADTITNSINVKLFAALGFEQTRFWGVTEDLREKNRFAWNLDEKIAAGQGILMIGLELFLMYMGIRLWQNGILTVGDFVLIQSYLVIFFHQLWGFGRVLRNFYQDLADAEEMTVILNTPHEVTDVQNAKRLHVRRGKIEFDNVSFSYTEQSAVIKDLSLRIKPGEKVALIGPSGGGKSTIIKLLLRLFDIQKGAILIDDQNIQQVTQNSLREQLTMVPQDPILFHRTLMENIRYGRREASDKEVIAAAKMAHCHEFITELPKKYDTYVGERGVKLSGGERQRVAIARAILANAPILILDEATSSLDSESERYIQDALENLMKQKTTLVIAHRLSTIMQMDRVLVIKGGGIIEEGTHTELVSKQGSLYKRLWDIQVGGYLE